MRYRIEYHCKRTGVLLCWYSSNNLKDIDERMQYVIPGILQLKVVS